MPKNPSAKQARYLLSKVSPLNPEQKKAFKSELHSGAAKIKKGK